MVHSTLFFNGLYKYIGIINLLVIFSASLDSHISQLQAEKIGAGKDVLMKN